METRIDTGRLRVLMERVAVRMSVVLLVVGLAAAAPAAAAECAGEVSGSGTATYYDFTPGSGFCSFGGDDLEPFTVAVSPTDYAGSAMCGRWLRVTGPLGSVDVRVVDQCPSCATGSLDLNTAAFAEIANLATGIVPVTWYTIREPGEPLLKLQQSAGTNPFYLQVQPRHPRYGVSRLEYLGPSGYVEATRSVDHYFTVSASSGVPVPLASPFTVRLTDVNGQQIVQTGIALGANNVHDCDVQFPYCATLAVPRPATPGRLALLAPAPNPSRRATVFSFDLAAEGDVVMRLHDAAGRRVRTLVDAHLPAGRHRAEWLGTDDAGRPLGAGIYFCRLSSGSAVDQKQVVLVD